MINLSNWRSARLWESGVERQLRQRHRLWLHGWLIGSIVMSVMWLSSYLQMRAGGDSLAVRYAVTLGIGYLVYMLVLRIWAGALVGERPGDPGFDGGSTASGSGRTTTTDEASTNAPEIRSGEGGDFGGGGATGDFSDASDAASGLGNAVSGALEVSASADEGAIVVVPVMIVFLLGCTIVFGAGSLAILYFGWDVLLTVAVELAFSYVSARTAVGIVREGWLSAAIRLTWKPLLGALISAVLLGAAIDHFIPDARSFSQAIKLMRP